MDRVKGAIDINESCDEKLPITEYKVIAQIK